MGNVSSVNKIYLLDRAWNFTISDFVAILKTGLETNI